MRLPPILHSLVRTLRGWTSRSESRSAVVLGTTIGGAIAGANISNDGGFTGFLKNTAGGLLGGLVGLGLSSLYLSWANPLPSYY